jgi:uncharacterized protein involved in exopolysaccharide biosynthesis
MAMLLRSEREQFELDLARVRVALHHGRVAAWIVFASVIALGLLYVIFAKRTYDSDAMVVAAEVTDNGIGGALQDMGSLATLAATMGFGNLDTGKLNESLALLQSRSFIGKFIRDHNLKPRLFPLKWDDETKSWRFGWLLKPPTDEDAFQKFTDDVLDVHDDPATGLVTVRVTWKDPVEGAAWANELVDRLNLQLRTKAVKDADRMMAYLEKELERTDLVTVKESIFKLAETQLNQRAVANVREEFAPRFVDRAIPKDKKNYDHPKPLLVEILVGLVAGVLALATGVARGWKRSRVATASSRDRIPQVTTPVS